MNGGDNTERNCSPEQMTGYMKVTASLAVGAQGRIWVLNKQVQRVEREVKLEIRIN